jgi:hypothetical protein
MPARPAIRRMSRGPSLKRVDVNHLMLVGSPGLDGDALDSDPAFALQTEDDHGMTAPGAVRLPYPYVRRRSSPVHAPSDGSAFAHWLPARR